MKLQVRPDYVMSTVGMRTEISTIRQAFNNSFDFDYKNNRNRGSGVLN